MRICYVNFNTKNPRDIITLRGLKENNIKFFVVEDDTPGIKKFLNIKKKINDLENNYDVIMVGYTGSILIPFLRIISKKKVVYNALATFFDSMVISRGKGLILSFSALRFYLIDFFAFHFAHAIFIECDTQKKLISKTFGVNLNKIFVHFVGVDDSKFYFDPAVKKLDTFTVIFRGKFLAEAGIDVVIKAAKELENKNINIRIIGHGLLKDEACELKEKLQPKNLELITEILPIEILRNMMLECHVSLGQMADHPRVETTIPHKAFETIAMKLPYLTGRNKGVLEALEENKTCLCSIPGDHKDLMEKIITLKKNPDFLKKIADNGFHLYQTEFTPKILAEKMLNRLSQI